MPLIDVRPRKMASMTNPRLILPPAESLEKVGLTRPMCGFSGDTIRAAAEAAFGTAKRDPKWQ
jgi:hypothetical protein